jgi:hypothetical protein
MQKESGYRALKTSENPYFASGASCRTRPDFSAVASQICLILLGIQALPVLSDRIFFNPFGVRFGVRKSAELMKA